MLILFNKSLGEFTISVFSYSFFNLWLNLKLIEYSPNLLSPFNPKNTFKISPFDQFGSIAKPQASLWTLNSELTKPLIIPKLNKVSIFLASFSKINFLRKFYDKKNENPILWFVLIIFKAS